MVLGLFLAFGVMERKFVRTSLYTGAVSRVGNYTHLLSGLRTGKVQETIDLLEVALDGELITLSRSKKGDLDATATNFSARASTYREIYPRKFENKEVENAVRRALSVPEK